MEGDAMARQPTESVSAISPTEDLMREHGVLIRLLLIYREIIECLIKAPILDFSSIGFVVGQTATIARRFVEDYHQKLEEQYVFPQFLRSGVDVDLVHVLLEQHSAARRLTAQILQIAPALNPLNRSQLVEILWWYVRMYEPHTGREDTVLFPDFRELVSPDELKELGNLFEDIEEREFGEDGFRRVVDQVAQLERILGIYDLALFTPPESAFCTIT